MSGLGCRLFETSRLAHHALTALILIVLLTSCGSDTSTVRPTDMVMRGDSVRLLEPDSLALGPRSPLLLRTPDGRMVLAEFPGRAVHAYAADGQYLGAFGRPGAGPGELGMVTGMGLLPGDSLLGIVDFSRARFILYRLEDRAFVREVPLAEPLMPGVGWAAVGETAILPMFGSANPFNALTTTSGAVQSWGGVPEGWTETNRAAGFARPVAVPVGTRILTALPFDPIVQWRDHAGRVLASEPLPRRIRRGEPPDAVERIRLVSHSAGTLLAYEYLRAHPQRVAEIVLVGALPHKNGGAYYDAEHRRLWQGLGDTLAAFNDRPAVRRELDRVDRDTTLPEARRIAAMRRVNQASEIYHVERWPQLVPPRGSGTAARRTRETTNFEYDYGPDLAWHAHQVTVINGEFDYLVGPRNSPLWHRLQETSAPNIVIVVIPEAGHSVWYDQPDQFRDAIRRALGG